jgi:Putative zinc-finger
VTCPEVRERLTEHALGLLPKPDRREIDRHLEWCPGCRKESAELAEGATAVGLAIPPVDPPTSLEGRIVERLRVFTGRSATPSRGKVRMLTAATLVAGMLAASSLGWALAERGKLQTETQRMQARIDAAEALMERFAVAHQSVINVLPETGAKNYLATLAPPVGLQGGGSAFISSQKDALNFLYVNVVLPTNAEGPYLVQLLDGRQALRGGYLVKPAVPDGDWTLTYWSGYDLSKIIAITILDHRTGATILTGAVQRYPSA